MTQKYMTGDEKFNHYAVGAILLVLGSLILSLGLYGIWFAFFGNHDQPSKLFMTSLMATLAGGGADVIAYVCISHARRTPLRPY